MYCNSIKCLEPALVCPSCPRTDPIIASSYRLHTKKPCHNYCEAGRAEVAEREVVVLGEFEINVKESRVDSESHFEAVYKVHGFLGGSCGHEKYD